MATSKPDTQALTDKIRPLPTERIVEVEDSVDLPKTRAGQRNQAAQVKRPLDFPVESVGEWPTDLSLRREDMYGDDGR